MVLALPEGLSMSLRCWSSCGGRGSPAVVRGPYDPGPVVVGVDAASSWRIWGVCTVLRACGMGADVVSL